MTLQKRFYAEKLKRVVTPILEKHDIDFINAPYLLLKQKSDSILPLSIEESFGNLVIAYLRKEGDEWGIDEQWTIAINPRNRRWIPVHWLCPYGQTSLPSEVLRHTNNLAENILMLDWLNSGVRCNSLGDEVIHSP